MINGPPSELVRFAEELRRRRQQRRMTLKSLGAATNVSLSLVHKIERAQRWPSGAFAERCDIVFGTAGIFAAMMPALDRLRRAGDLRYSPRPGSSKTPRKSSQRVDRVVMDAMDAKLPQSMAARLRLCGEQASPLVRSSGALVVRPMINDGLDNSRVLRVVQREPLARPESLPLNGCGGYDERPVNRKETL